MMIRLAAFLACSTLGIATAFSASPLRSEVVVDRAIVTLGDFFPDAGPLAATPLFRAPDLGTSGKVAASLVVERARQAGFDAAATDGLDEVYVRRRALVIEQEQVEAAILEDLLARNPHLAPGTVELSIFGFNHQVLADPSASRPVAVEQLTWQANTGRLEAKIHIATGKITETYDIRGQATELVEVYTLTDTLERGRVISESDLGTIRLPRSRVTERMVTNPSAVVGLAARRSLRPATPLQVVDFEQPVLVQRGDKVTVTFQTAGMKLTATAQALVNGTRGEVIDVMNPQSRRIISATVVGRGQVTVGGGFQTTASLQEAR